MTDSGSTLSTCACAFLPAGGAARLARACSHSRRMARRTATLVDWAPGMAANGGGRQRALCWHRLSCVGFRVCCSGHKGPQCISCALVSSACAGPHVNVFANILGACSAAPAHHIGWMQLCCRLSFCGQRVMTDLKTLPWVRVAFDPCVMQIDSSSESVVAHNGYYT